MVDDALISKGRVLAFALPVLEQYFAGRAILRSGDVTAFAGELTALARWRHGLALAVSTGGWDQVAGILDTLSRTAPGVAVWVPQAIHAGLLDRVRLRVAPSLEAARRLRRGLTGWAYRPGVVDLVDYARGVRRLRRSARDRTGVLLVGTRPPRTRSGHRHAAWAVGRADRSAAYRLRSAQAVALRYGDQQVGVVGDDAVYA
ncbi:hypothetical protein JOD54_005479 [Actinokineospora baliensis]|uniref:hypothetical protein n=1 Tax=Actinokineospora baliensis TaxID=547056 RepID=UPI00195D1C32|nr:hypothetical protein [Actinokineospora baliensis]MBM7775275.1 hypothetical protein [Actinokineospora baliensis]